MLLNIAVRLYWNLLYNRMMNERCRRSNHVFFSDSAPHQRIPKATARIGEYISCPACLFDKRTIAIRRIIMSRVTTSDILVCTANSGLMLLLWRIVNSLTGGAMCDLSAELSFGRPSARMTVVEMCIALHLFVLGTSLSIF